MGRQSQRLRIIGGEHRGRILNFTPVDGLRPTPDRVRETVFNWLQPVIHGAHCLDLFAGSGAMGLEAISRGASDVTFVESHARTADQIKQHIDTLKAENVSVHQLLAQKFIERSERHFDVVFLDPPYGKDLLYGTCQQLEQASILADKAWIYLESEFAVTQEQLPDGWDLSRSKQAGQVFYHLAVR